MELTKIMFRPDNSHMDYMTLDPYFDTGAPISANSMPQNGPAMKFANSSTCTPSSGLAIFMLSLDITRHDRRHLSPLPRPGQCALKSAQCPNQCPNQCPINDCRAV